MCRPTSWAIARETTGRSVAGPDAVLVLEKGTRATSYGATIAYEIQRRFFDQLDQPVKRLVGGKAAPTISRVLDMAAHPDRTAKACACAAVLADSGRLPRAAE